MSETACPILTDRQHYASPVLSDRVLQGGHLPLQPEVLLLLHLIHPDPHLLLDTRIYYLHVSGIWPAMTAASHADHYHLIMASCPAPWTRGAALSLS